MVNNLVFKLNLGGGTSGSQPKGGLLGGGANSTSGSGMEGGNNRAMNRKVLRSAFGNEVVNVKYHNTGNDRGYQIHYHNSFSLNPLENGLVENNVVDYNLFSISTWDISGSSNDNTLDTIFSNYFDISENTIISGYEASASGATTIYHLTIKAPTKLKLNQIDASINSIKSRLPNSSVAISNEKIISVYLTPKITQTSIPINNLSGLTPFRRTMNAGDTNLTVNKSTSRLLKKPPNQVGLQNSSLSGLKKLAGAVHTIPVEVIQNLGGQISVNQQGSFYTGNPRYVYDGADYTRFKKLQAVNRNYNDRSFGGDQHNASQQAYRRTHR